MLPVNIDDLSVEIKYLITLMRSHSVNYIVYCMYGLSILPLNLNDAFSK